MTIREDSYCIADCNMLPVTAVPVEAVEAGIRNKEWGLAFHSNLGRVEQNLFCFIFFKKIFFFLRCSKRAHSLFPQHIFGNIYDLRVRLGNGWIFFS